MVQGQLGLNDLTQRIVPTLITHRIGSLTITAVSAGSYHSLFLTSTGAVYATGHNVNGQLGVGDFTQRNVPTLITSVIGSLNIIDISTGSNHSLFLTSAGAVYATGNNYCGELGLGDTNNRNIPTLITSGIGSLTITTASAIGDHSLFLTSAGAVYAAGYNATGQLGLGDNNSRSTPIFINGVGGVTITAVSGGYYHSLFLTSTGTVYATGYNGNGQLGLGDTSTSTIYYIPTLMSSGTYSRLSDIPYRSAYSFSYTPMPSGPRTLLNYLQSFGYNQDSVNSLGLNRATLSLTSYSNLGLGNTYFTKTNSVKVIQGDNNKFKPDGWAVFNFDNTISQNQIYGDTGIFDGSSPPRFTSDSVPFIPTPGTSWTIMSNIAGFCTVSQRTFTGITPAAYTYLIDNTSVDDNFVQLSVPWNVYFLGNTWPGNMVFLGSNTYLTFGGGSVLYNVGLTASTPPLSKIIIGSADNSYQRVATTMYDDTYRVRYEGTNSTSGTVGNPNIVIEFVFYRYYQNIIDINIESHARLVGFTGYYPGYSINTNMMSYFGGEVQSGGQGGLGTKPIKYGIIWGWASGGWRKLIQLPLDYTTTSYNHKFSGWWNSGYVGTTANGNGKYAEYDSTTITYIGFSVQNDSSTVPLLSFQVAATLTATRNVFVAKYVLNSTLSFNFFTTTNTDSSLTRSFASTITGVATIPNSSLASATISGPGTTTINATQNESANFLSVAVPNIMTIVIVGANTTYSSIDMTSLDLTGADITNSAFTNCIMTSVNLFGATVNISTNLSSATLTSLKSGRIAGITALLPSGFKLI